MDVTVSKELWRAALALRRDSGRYTDPVSLGEEGDVGQGLVRAATDGAQARHEAAVDQLRHMRVVPGPCDKTPAATSFVSSSTD